MNKRFAATSLIFFCICFLIACGRNQGQVPGAGGAPPAMAVKTVKATLQPVGQYTEYISTLKSRTSADIRPEVEGQIIRIMVNAGDHVEAGAPILEIDPRRQEAAVSSTEASRRSKEAALEWARTELDRRKKLFAAGVIAKADLDQAQTQYDSAKADVDALAESIREQRVQLRYYTVKAPAAGTIGDIPVHIGDRVQVTTVLTSLDRGGELEAYISVPAEKSGSVKVGTPVEIVPDGGGQPVKTSVSFVAPRVDPTTQLLLVKALVPNADHRFRNEQLVHVRVVYQQLQKPLIPVTAVSRLGGATFAFVAESDNGKLVARQKPVQLGDVQGNDYVILNGINPGEQIIVTGVQMLQDGMPVQTQS